MLDLEVISISFLPIRIVLPTQLTLESKIPADAVILTLVPDVAAAVNVTDDNAYLK